MRNGDSSKRSVRTRIHNDPYSVLISLGCDEDELKGLLIALEWAVGREKWFRLTGMSPKRMRDVVVKNLRKTAKEVSNINSKLGFFLQEMQYPDEYRMLPRLLSTYASDLVSLSRTGGEKRRPMFQGMKNELVNYVKEKTGRFRDEEVASLLSDLLNNPSYDACQHKDWRRNFNKK